MMNGNIHHINDIIKQVAGLKYDSSIGNFECDRKDLYDFAGLVVRECAKFLEENSGHDAANNSWHPEPEDLLNHFGVK